MKNEDNKKLNNNSISNGMLTWVTSLTQRGSQVPATSPNAKKPLEKASKTTCKS